MKVYKKLLHYVPKERYIAYIAITMTTISAAITVSAYYYLYTFLDNLIVKGHVSSLESDAINIILLMIIGFLLYFASVILTHVLGFRLETNLRKKGIEGLSKASFSFYDMNSSGTVRKIIDDNALLTHNIIAHLIPDNSSAIVTPILTIILGFVISIRVGFALLTLCCLAAILLKFMMGNKDHLKRFQDSLEKLSSEAVEYVRGIQVIKIFGANVTSLKSLHKAITDYSHYALAYSLTCKRPYVIYQWLFLGISAIMVPFAIYFGESLTLPKSIAVEIIMTLFLSGVLFSSFMKVMYVSMYSFQGTMAVDKLEKLYEEMGKNQLKFGNKKIVNNFDIEFNNVSFGYTDEMVLNNFNYKFNAGKSYALVGPSGCGKSTIVKLLSGFYNVNKGCIKIGGEKLEAYTEKTISNNISFVFQDAKLFKTTIYENVSLANEKASKQEVLEALHQAGCDNILNKLEDKENTIIGSKGIYLSGGEKQRIAIARAILKNASIVVLDEASAAIDPENEHELQKAFSNLMKNKTVIMIAHRLTSIKDVDKILVLEDGKIIEEGNHQELIDKNSKYKSYQELYNIANEWRV